MEKPGGLCTLCQAGNYDERKAPPQNCPLAIDFGILGYQIESTTNKNNGT
jgi:hypothetical protein